MVGGAAYSTRHTLMAQLVTVAKAAVDSNLMGKPPMSPAAPSGLLNDINIALATTSHTAEITHSMDSQRKARFRFNKPLGAATIKDIGVAKARIAAATNAGS